MDGKAAGTVDLKGAIADFVELIAKALLSGVAVAVAMAAAILLLSAQAQAAAPGEARTGTLLFQSKEGYIAAPKVATEVAVEVTGMIARTRVTQIFHNPGAEFVEGLYVFPLPEKAAVDHLWMRVGERVIEGRIQEKAAARRTYEKARAEGRKAALLEQQRPNLFTSAVAHIGPDDRIEVKIEYQQALAYENGRYRLRFPLAVTPRYVPRNDPIPDVAKDPEAIELDAALQQSAYEAPGCGPANPVDIAVTLDAGVPLAEVVSSYHDTVIERAEKGHGVSVFLLKDQEEADRDFELTWTVAPASAPRAAIFSHRTGDRDYALLMVVPPEADAQEKAAFQRMPREMLLVVDTSGSMQGASIEQARQALDYALSTLTERDRFNVVEFNSSTRPMWPGALVANAANVRHARQWIAELKANGGTEMAPALAFALDGRDTPGYLRQVVFITDGAVGNEESLFRLIESRLGASRLFTVSIGSAPNSHFMARAAQFGRGTFTHVGDLREVHEKMAALFAKIEAPVLRDVQVRWPDGAEVETFPPRVPDLYLGEPVLVAVSARAPLGTVTVSGVRGNQPWSVALTPSAGEPKSPQQVGDPRSSVSALWARFKIAALMDAITRGGDAEAIRPQVVKVAMDHHLVSAYTSLVAVDVTPSAPAGDPRAAMVKASLPAGYADGMQLPQTDTPATLHLLMGLMALAATALFTIVGRRASLAA